MPARLNKQEWEEWNGLSSSILLIRPRGLDLSTPHEWARWEEIIQYGVSEDGAVFCSGDRSDQVTVGDLRRAIEAGILPGDALDLVLFVVPPQGGGVAEIDFVRFLLSLGVNPAQTAFDIIALWAFERATRGLRSKTSRYKMLKRARAVAKDWESRGIEHPYALRLLIDSRSEWTVSDLAKLLRISPRPARELLVALGLEHKRSGSTWVHGRSRKARRRRHRWDREENP
jgi:hypothetical protein